MRESIKTVLDNYQVRKTYKQKSEFISWLDGHLKELGYELIIDEYSKSGRNLLVGDVEKAQIVLGAHYDTQPNFFMPMFMAFSNWISFILSQLLILIPLGLFYLIYSYVFVYLLNGGIGASLIGELLILLYLVQMLVGIANKHTANDNTSGVTTLISILEDLPAADRSKVCVVFFDQEELGMIGSIKFSKKYEKTMKNKPLINFDCVSDGETLNFISKKKFRDSEYYGLLQEAAEKAMSTTNKKLRFADALTNIYTSDQLNFPQGVGVVAAKKAPIVGYYIDRIHSALDTRFDEENIELIKDSILGFVAAIN